MRAYLTILNERIRRFSNRFLGGDDRVKLRNYDKRGNPLCDCGAITDPAYAKHPFLTCWRCGRLMGFLTEREGLAAIAALNNYRNFYKLKRCGEDNPVSEDPIAEFAKKLHLDEMVS